MLGQSTDSQSCWMKEKVRPNLQGLNSKVCLAMPKGEPPGAVSHKEELNGFDRQSVMLLN